ncbi:MAG: peptide deformylase [Gemmatimonadota bacterium]|jgi:peptide deformylase|nr:peptide deformylase [Gemmatimonadota bacterium]
MAVLKIEKLGSSVLRRKADEIEEIDPELRELIADMFDTMYEAEGVGLAGPQIGVSRRVVVIDVNNPDHPRMALINPRIVDSDSRTAKEEEGCLSIPGVSAFVKRPEEVEVEAIDESGRPVRVRAGGLLGRCLQHEIDHLNGVLFIDYLSPLKRSMVLKKYRQMQAEEEAEAREKSRDRSREGSKEGGQNSSTRRGR